MKKSRFLPRDAMHKRGYSRHAVSVHLCVCLVCLSVTFVDHVKTNKHIFEFFDHRVATPFWFFHTKRGGDIPTGTFSNGVSNASGVGKKRDSGRISGCIGHLCIGAYSISTDNDLEQPLT